MNSSDHHSFAAKIQPRPPVVLVRLSISKSSVVDLGWVRANVDCWRAKGKGKCRLLVSLVADSGSHKGID